MAILTSKLHAARRRLVVLLEWLTPRSFSPSSCPAPFSARYLCSPPKPLLFARRSHLSWGMSCHCRDTSVTAGTDLMITAGTHLLMSLVALAITLYGCVVGPLACMELYVNAAAVCTDKHYRPLCTVTFSQPFRRFYRIVICVASRARGRLLRIRHRHPRSRRQRRPSVSARCSCPFALLLYCPTCPVPFFRLNDLITLFDTHGK